MGFAKLLKQASSPNSTPVIWVKVSFRTEQSLVDKQSFFNEGCIRYSLTSPGLAIYLLVRTSRYQWIGKVSRNGVPHRALLVSTVGIFAAILLAVFAPKNAFLMLYGIAVAGMLFVWLVILASHLRFRKSTAQERISKLPMRLPVHPLLTLAGIAFTARNFDDDFFRGLQWSVPLFVYFGDSSLLWSPDSGNTESARNLLVRSLV
ncbi:MAG TPA: hypothetical protein VGS27_10970 [Candidatus Sulfotelmatobacter sp.]|nr:hypothetical protein [Candidatus Sulfotelmatobacter sp.]